MTRNATPDEYADRERDYAKHEWRPGDRAPLDQRCAVAKLIGYCEGLVNSGLLGADLETKLRANIAETLVAFNMPSKTERESADA
jgi:hypothetical protein